MEDMPIPVLVFTRLPQPGSSKTRLIPALGPTAAADLQRQMTEHLMTRLRRAAELDVAQPIIWYAGDDAAAMRRWLGEEWAYRQQVGSDLGQRLQRAFQEVFATGAAAALVIGCDVPGIDLDHLVDARRQLDTHDVVMGPALDGGYYLLGLCQSTPELFIDMPWGGTEVAALTRTRCRQRGLSLAELPPLADVDRPEDLPVWEAARRG
jgi:uncharacterized protein